MKIALVNYNHSDRVYGGVETRYNLLERALTDAGHDCVMISTEFQVFEEIAVILDGVDLIIEDSAVGLAWPRPTITIFGNPWYSVLTLGPSKHFEQVIRREVAWHRAYQTTRVAVSNFMRAEVRAGGISCHHVVPNPCDIGRFPNRLKFRPPTALWVGPEIAVKNPGVVPALSAALSEYQWVTLSREGPTKRSYDEMTDVIGGSSAVVCTSFFEGCSNTLMEAIAADVPIVTTRTGYFWDFWDDRFGRIVTDPNDCGGFAAAVKDVMMNPASFKPREAALERGIDYSSWARRWQRLVEEARE